jgi:hypothetical protein
VTDDRQLPTEPDHGPDTEREPVSSPAEPAPGRRHAPPLPPPTRREPSSADVRPRRPDYRGEELDPERGPGLGCFWFQVIVLGFFIVIIPVGLNLNWPFEVLAILLFVVIGLLLLTGQTVIFLLRLVAADRRSQGRRRPLASQTKTVGEIEDELGPEGEADAPPDRAPAAAAMADASSDGTSLRDGPPEAAASSGADDVRTATEQVAPDAPAEPPEPAAEPASATEPIAVAAAEPLEAAEPDEPPPAPDAAAEPLAAAELTTDSAAEPLAPAEPNELEEPDPGVRQ